MKLKKYVDEIDNELNRYVGVHTGALKSSINVNSSGGDIFVSFLDYGKYINPWKTKTGIEDRPGYQEIIEDVYEEMKNDIYEEVNIMVKKYWRI